MVHLRRLNPQLFSSVLSLTVRVKMKFPFFPTRKRRRMCRKKYYLCSARMWRLFRVCEKSQIYCSRFALSIYEIRIWKRHVSGLWLKLWYNFKVLFSLILRKNTSSLSTFSFNLIIFTVQSIVRKCGGQSKHEPVTYALQLDAEMAFQFQRRKETTFIDIS